MKAPKGYIILSSFFKEHGGNYKAFRKLIRKGYIVYGEDYITVNAIHRRTWFVNCESIGKIVALQEKYYNKWW